MGVRLARPRQQRRQAVAALAEDAPRQRQRLSPWRRHRRRVDAVAGPQLDLDLGAGADREGLVEGLGQAVDEQLLGRRPAGAGWDRDQQLLGRGRDPQLCAARLQAQGQAGALGPGLEVAGGDLAQRAPAGRAEAG